MSLLSCGNLLCLCSRKLCKLLEISAGFGESSLEVSRLAAVRLVEHCCVLVAAASCPRPLRPAHAALRPLRINGIAASNRPATSHCGEMGYPITPPRQWRQGSHCYYLVLNYVGLGPVVCGPPTRGCVHPRSLYGTTKTPFMVLILLTGV